MFNFHFLFLYLDCDVIFGSCELIGAILDGLVTKSCNLIGREHFPAKIPAI